MDTQIKLLYEDSRIPTRGSRDAAGYDLYARLGTLSLAIQPHTTAKISAGFAMTIPKGFAGFVFARSGIATKKSLRPANAVGVVDADYTGEVFVPLHNDSDEVQVIEDGDRIAQLIVMPFQVIDWIPVEELSITSRGVGGFGSTGN